MYVNADTLPHGTTLRGYDLCIVGAGAAGIAIAQRLIGTNKKVLLVSAGASTDRDTPPSPVSQSIYQGTLGPFMQKVNNTFLQRSRLRMYGGSTNHFIFAGRPLEAVDLQARPGCRDAHWPITMEELNRYYPDANVFGNYGPSNYDDIPFWEEALHGTTFPALPSDQMQSAVFHWQNNKAINHFQRQYGERLQEATNVTVLFNANVLQIEATERKEHVAGLACATIEGGKKGRDFRIEAGTYVLAQGGIEPVRLLKLSGNLGDNTKGHLGRGFMLHPVIGQAAKLRFSTPIPTLIQNFYDGRHVTISPLESGQTDYQVINGPVYQSEELEGSYEFHAHATLTPTPQALANERIGNFYARLQFQFEENPNVLGLGILWEQLPNENSTITLNESQRDPVFNQPVVQLDWNLLEQDKHTIQRGLEICRDYLYARGGTDFELITDLSGGPEQWDFSPFPPPNQDPKALWPGDHHMGALRMSAQPADGIVNPDMKVHTVDNLYVAGSGVYPTGGYANPTLTIVALALRLADHLKAKA